MVTVRLSDGSTVTGELVKTAKTAVKNLTFRIQPACPTSWKGKQRQIVHDIIRTEPERYWTVEEVAELAAAKGLSAVGGVVPSVQYHLHQLELLGFVDAK